MLNVIWVCMMLVSYLFAIAYGRVDDVTQALFIGTQTAVQTVFSLVGTICFWSGLLEIMSESGLIFLIQRVLGAPLRLLFPGLNDDTEATAAISLNISANILGLSNAATPLGLAAMKQLQKRNLHPHIATDEMCMFVVINSASLSIFPTTLISMRSAYGSAAPTCVLPAVWIVSAVSLLTGVLCAACLGGKK